MASIRIGGDPEQYMDAPTLSVGGEGKGGFSFIAGLLDVLGIHKQVAKGAKESAGGTAEESAPAQQPKSPHSSSVSLSVLDDANKAFQPMMPLPSDFGSRWLESINPLGKIDPNSGL